MISNKQNQSFSEGGEENTNVYKIYIFKISLVCTKSDHITVITLLLGMIKNKGIKQSCITTIFRIIKYNDDISISILTVGLLRSKLLVK